MNRLSSTDAAWLAGYIDGDGCICLHRDKPRRYMTATIVIDSADHEILRHVQAITGAGFLVLKKSRRSNHRQCASWRLRGVENIKALLSQVHPFLRCDFKRERARMLIEEWAACTPRNGAYTTETHAAKSDFEARFMAIGVGRGKRAA